VLLYYLIFSYTDTTKERREGEGGLGGAKPKTYKHVNMMHYHTTVKKF